ncbi:MAG TPA: PAS domain S-box protein [Candidatus Manganitrophaceae bacterium]|nr:PAS domain S-box protein [Candidatus Manganitrophaceae bacterium]
MTDAEKSKEQLLEEMKTLRERMGRMERAETKFWALLESAPDAIVIIDGDRRISLVNAQAETLFGYPRQELAGQPIEVLVPERFRETHADHCARYISKPIIRPMGGGGSDFSGRRKDGSEFPAEISLSPMNTEEGVLVVSIIRDTTRRKQAEAERRKLAGAIEQTDDSVVITDREGVIEYVNPAFERKTGYTREEAIGKTPRIVKSGLQGADFYVQLWATVLQGEVFRGMLINKRKNGELYYEEKTITPLKDDKGVITHYVSTGKDVTKRIKMEKNLEEVRVEKERLEAIRALSMTYAHNILNAITPVKSYAERILKITDPSDPRQKWAESIIDGTADVVKIVRRLEEIDTFSVTELGGMKMLDLDRLKKRE